PDRATGCLLGRSPVAGTEPPLPVEARREGRFRDARDSRAHAGIRGGGLQHSARVYRACELPLAKLPGAESGTGGHRTDRGGGQDRNDEEDPGAGATAARFRLVAAGGERIPDGTK